MNLNVAFATFFCFVIPVSGKQNDYQPTYQPSGKEVFELLNASASYNMEYNGIFDLNQLWPGQKMNFVDEKTRSVSRDYVILPDDNAWVIATIYLIEKHQVDIASLNDNEGASHSDSSLLFFKVLTVVLFLVVVILLGVIWQFLRQHIKGKKEEYLDFNLGQASSVFAQTARKLLRVKTQGDGSVSLKFKGESLPILTVFSDEEEKENPADNLSKAVIHFMNITDGDVSVVGSRVNGQTSIKMDYSVPDKGTVKLHFTDPLADKVIEENIRHREN